MGQLKGNFSMRRHDHQFPRGDLHRGFLDSSVLAGNMQGDPTRRELPIYTPPGWTREQKLPLLVDLVGFFGSGLSHVAFRAVGENVPERLDRLIGEGAMPPVVVAFPDCSTRLGGNQYINSSALGRYADYIIDEIVPYVENTYNCGGPGRRGCFGKSSGGFGAAWHAMERPDVWSTAAINSADMAFEACYLPDYYTALDVLRTHGYSLEAFVRAFESKLKPTQAERTTLMILCMAAEYDPDPSAFLGIRLPGDPHTGELDPTRWGNWLRYDPVNMVDTRLEALRSLKYLYLDCGSRDQFRMQYGMRRFVRKLEGAKVPHLYEEFDDDHSDIDYRMNRFLPLLAQALT